MEGASCYVNYTKPVGAIGVVWKVKDSGGSVLIGPEGYNCDISGYNCEYDLIIPQSCWNYDSSKLLLNPDEPGGDLYWKCYNGTEWVTLLYTNEGDGNMFEEAIWWKKLKV